MDLKTTLRLLSILPCALLLFNDLLIKPLPLPPNSIWAYDDIFKMLIFTPLQIYFVHKVDSHMIETTDFLSYLFVSLYAFGFGVNQSVNAIDSYIARLKVANPQFELDGDVEKAVYFWDERVGHLISAAAFYGMQMRWVWNIAKNATHQEKLVAKTKTRSHSKYGLFDAFGVLAGYTTGLVCLEAQAVPFALSCDLLIALLVFMTALQLQQRRQLMQKNSNSRLMLRYVCSMCITQVCLFGAWSWFYGWFVEPTMLHQLCGWTVPQVMTLGFLGTSVGNPCPVCQVHE